MFLNDNVDGMVDLMVKDCKWTVMATRDIFRGPEEIRKLAYKVQSVGFGGKQPKVAEHYIQGVEQGLTYSWNGAYDLIRHMEKLTFFPQTNLSNHSMALTISSVDLTLPTRWKNANAPLCLSSDLDVMASSANTCWNP